MAKKTLRAEALELFQKLRRMEEADDDGYARCVSCSKSFHYTKMDGGHFIPKGQSSYWSLEPENVWPQCKGCNGFGMRYGSAAHSYTLFMEDKFGRLFVENMLETKKDVKKLYAADYREMIADFKQRIKTHEKRLL